jgi:hypothetical protein
VTLIAMRDCGEVDRPVNSLIAWQLRSLSPNSNSMGIKKAGQKPGLEFA